MGMEIDRIYNENCLETLKRMPDEFLDCCVTSPPYWALRDYGNDTETVWDSVDGCLHEWDKRTITLKHKSGETNPGKESWFKDKGASDDRGNQFCKKCGAWKGALGLEPDFNLYVKHLCDIFDEMKRALKKEGTVWVNIGDTYHNALKWTNKKECPQTISGGNNRNYNTIKRTNQGISEKCLSLIPFRFVIEMTNRGWILRNTVIWHKPNCMPASVKDRFTVDFEYLFFFTKSRRYWFEQQFEPHNGNSGWAKQRKNGIDNITPYQTEGNGKWAKPNIAINPLGRNKRTVWTMPEEPIALFGKLARKINDFKEAHPEIDEGWFDDLIAEIYTDNFVSSVWNVPTRPFPGAHFAVFPQELIETPIRAGCPKSICKKCGKAREKIYRKTGNLIGMGGYGSKTAEYQGVSPTSSLLTKKVQEKELVGYSDCGCDVGFEPGIVYDPFVGAGTTAVVAKRLGRHFIGSEMNPDYIEIAETRIKGTEWDRQLDMIRNWNPKA